MNRMVLNFDKEEEFVDCFVRGNISNYNAIVGISKVSASMISAADEDSRAMMANLVHGMIHDELQARDRAAIQNLLVEMQDDFENPKPLSFLPSQYQPKGEQ